MILSYSSPDQYEKAVSVPEEGYFRNWVRCSQCGLHYSTYSRDPHAMEQIYEIDYRSAAVSWRSASVEEIFNRVIALPYEESETKQRISWIKKQIAEIQQAGLIKKSEGRQKALDVGGSSGVFAYEFQDDQWSVAVIDPSRDGLFLTERYGIPYTQSMYAPGLFGHQFDLVTLLFTLEHVLNPADILEQVAEDMHDDSLLYIEVPDALSFRFKEPDDDIFNSSHLWMFCPASLTRLIDRCGYQLYLLRRTRTVRDHLALTGLFGKKNEN